MKIKTSELRGAALDWAVAMCAGEEVSLIKGQLETRWTDDGWKPSTDWAQAGPIIEWEMITVGPAKHEGYMAWAWPKGNGFWGDAPLIAAMRCYVASKLGDEVEIPEEIKEK